MDYSLIVHRHRFAAWAAARAAQRKLTGASVGVLVRALECAGFPQAVVKTVCGMSSAQEYDDFHRAASRKIVEFLTRLGVEATYGRAAKLVAVYLKSMVICGPFAGLAVSALIHPPLDRVLLTTIARNQDAPPSLRRLCGATAWTHLTEAEYFGLIAAIRECGYDRPAFWMLERYWDVSADD